MGERTAISWTDATFNPWIGCIRISEECEHCYAETLATNRMGLQVWGPAKTTPRRIASESYWRQPLKWDRQAEIDGVRRRVFCASMADVFEDHPQLWGSRARLYQLILDTPNLDWLLLTKRPENLRQMLPAAWLVAPQSNVWYGTSVGLQKWAAPRIIALLGVPAVVRFISAEPLLGPLDLTPWLNAEWVDSEAHEPRPGVIAGQRYRTALLRPGIDWLICGGESAGPAERRLVERCTGGHATWGSNNLLGNLCREACPLCHGTGWRPKPAALQWVRSLRDQAVAAGVAFFLKQWPMPPTRPGGPALLDGREWREFPVSEELVHA